jgi:hypothetical protein
MSRRAYHVAPLNQGPAGFHVLDPSVEADFEAIDNH